MSNNTEEIRKLRGQRLSACLKAFDLKQKDLVIGFGKEGKTICTESDVSQWINGNRLLSENKIADLLENVPAFKNVRKDYLLGDSEYMTYSEEFTSKVEFDDIVADSMWAIIEKSLSQHNMSLKFIHKNNGMHIDSFQRRFVNCWYEIKDNQDNLVLKMSAKDMIAFEEQIQDYVDFIVSKRINNAI